MLRILSAALLCAIPALAQLPGASTLNGIYNVRYLGVNTDPSDTAVSFQGTFTFDGKGGFTVTGQGVTVSGALKFQTSGKYTVFSSGALAMTNPFDPLTANGTTLYGGVGSTGVVFASSTDTFYCDFFIAIPAATGATNATLKGSYRVASLEFLGGSFSATRDTFFPLTADGSGGLGNVTIAGTAQSLNGTATTQTSAGATYTVSATGSGTLNFPAPNGVSAANTLLSGNKVLYVSSDGSLFIAGSSTGYDFVIGIQANSASTKPLNGLYFTGYLQNYAPGTANGGIYAGEGAANEIPALGSLEIIHQRTNPDGFASYDQVYDDVFTFQADGTSPYPDSNYAAGGSGNYAIGSGAGNTNYMLVLYMKAPAVTGSGVFLNPQGVVNAGNSAPFTAQHSPGEVITLYGTGLAGSDATASAPFPNTLGNVQVLVNGTAAPVYSVCASCNPNQISAVIPYTVSPDPSVPLTFQVSKGGTLSNIVNGYIGSTSPGIFTIPPGGISDGAIEHADGSVVTTANPAKPGETVAIFLTGLGGVDQKVAAGAPAPSSPLAKVVAQLAVYVGSGSDQQQATVQFAGLAPSLGGLYQVNVTIPTGMPAGDQLIEILTSVDGQSVDVDNAMATIPIGK